MNKSAERLFFALWPDQQLRDRLVESYAGIARLAGHGRLVAPANLHITLHYLGSIPLQQVDCFLAQAEKVKMTGFELNLNRLGYFGRARVSWIGPEQVPPALSQLYTALGESISACGYSPEQRPYHPHVTMARKIRQSPPLHPLKPIVWPVDRFVLVQSITFAQGVEYRVKASFALLTVPA